MKSAQFEKIYNAKTIPQRFLAVTEKYPTNNAQLIKGADGMFHPRTYKELQDEMLRVAFFLKKQCSIKQGHKITLISDNNEKWIVLDLALLSLGAIDVPRGSDTMPNEVIYIMEHSDCNGAIFEHAYMFEKIWENNKKCIEKLSFIFFINNSEKDIAILQKYKDILKKKNIFLCFYQDTHSYSFNDSHKESILKEISLGKGDDTATIIYTSGTTEIPKGACLSHRGFLFQIDAIVPDTFGLTAEHTLLSVLPVWHAYEREIQYIVMGTGGCIAYSKPIGKTLLADLASTNAQWMTSVPRIWEGVYSAIHRKIKQSSVVKRTIFTFAHKIGKRHAIATHMVKGTLTDYSPASKKQKRKSLVFLQGLIPYLFLMPLRFILDILVFKKIRALLGEKFLAGVSGGGALPSHVDWFFQAANITVIEGYGLTEAAPILSVRNQKRPEANSIGKILRGVEYKVLDKQGQPLSYGEKGILHVRSPQIMKGYYKNPISTKEVLNADGWLNTGDLVVIAKTGEIKIEGRAKETIVLRNGENIEPSYVESFFLKSDYIKQIMVVGNDQKHISALIVPDLEEVKISFSLSGYTSLEDICEMPKLKKVILNAIHEYNSELSQNNKIHRFAFIKKEFEIGDELTQTLKLKRSVIKEKYKTEISNMYTS